MRHEEFKTEGFTKTQTEKKVLVYTPQFKEWVREHPGVFSTAASIIKKLENKIPFDNLFDKLNQISYDRTEEARYLKYVGTFIEEERVKVTVVIYGGSVTYKVEHDNQSFFVKREDDSRGNLSVYPKYGGVHELLSSAQAKNLFKDLPPVEVVDFKFAFEEIDPKTQRKIKYFVSQWMDNIVRVGDYKAKNKKEEKFIESTIFEIEDILQGEEAAGRKGFFEMTDDDIFYNPKTKKLVILDINRHV